MRLVIDLRFSFAATLAAIRQFVRKSGDRQKALGLLAALAAHLPHCDQTQPEVAGTGSITLLLKHPRVGDFAAERCDLAIPAWAAVAYAAAAAAEAAEAEAAAEAEEADRVGEVQAGFGHGPITEEEEEMVPLEMVPLDKFLRG